MSEPSVRNPFFYREGKRFEAHFDNHSQFDHYFGARHELLVKSKSPLPTPFHQVLNLDTRDPLCGQTVNTLHRIPLVFPFTYDGGSMKYRIVDDNTIEIIELTGKPNTEDWPYAGYTRAFPEKRFSLTQPRVCTQESFADDVWQGIPDNSWDCLIAIVPGSGDYGVGLWDPDGGNDWIHVNFFFEPKSRMVTTYNTCD